MCFIFAGRRGKRENGCFGNVGQEILQQWRDHFWIFSRNLPFSVIFSITPTHLPIFVFFRYSGFLDNHSEIYQSGGYSIAGSPFRGEVKPLR